MSIIVCLCPLSINSFQITLWWCQFVLFYSHSSPFLMHAKSASLSSGLLRHFKWPQWPLCPLKLTSGFAAAIYGKTYFSFKLPTFRQASPLSTLCGGIDALIIIRETGVIGAQFYWAGYITSFWSSHLVCPFWWAFSEFYYAPELLVVICYFSWTRCCILLWLFSQSNCFSGEGCSLFVLLLFFYQKSAPCLVDCLPATPQTESTLQLVNSSPIALSIVSCALL